jgi:hypothetical protein
MDLAGAAKAWQDPALGGGPVQPIQERLIEAYARLPKESILHFTTDEGASRTTARCST